MEKLAVVWFRWEFICLAIIWGAFIFTAASYTLNIFRSKLLNDILKWIGIFVVFIIYCYGCEQVYLKYKPETTSIDEIHVETKPSTFTPGKMPEGSKREPSTLEEAKKALRERTEQL